MEDVDVETLGDAPGTAGVGKLRDAFIKNGGGRESQRAVNDIRVTGDPADVGHAPVNVFGMNVLVILRSARDVGEIAAGAMLAALGLAGLPVVPLVYMRKSDASASCETGSTI